MANQPRGHGARAPVAATKAPYSALVTGDRSIQNAGRSTHCLSSSSPSHVGSQSYVCANAARSSADVPTTTALVVTKTMPCIACATTSYLQLQAPTPGNEE